MQFAVSLDPFMMWSEPSLVKPKMPNPAPKSCEVQDCEYKIPMGLTSHEQQFQDIRLHLVMAHPQVAATLAAINNQAGQPGTPGPQSSVKAEKVFGLNNHGS